MPPLTAQQVRRFRRTVYAFFERHGRDLPWRRTRDPYAILVSEIMLQQTQVDRVAAKFEPFIAAFPTARALARASQSAVLAAWSGLGYNRRALHLQRCAAAIVDRFGGTVPCAEDDLASLPGIGQATAAAIAAYAFGVPSVFVETNIRTVYIHTFFKDRADVGDDELLPLVAATVDRRNARRWYSALMDYGASLKKQFKNPARRSRHHVRQSKFEGSARQLRGAVLRALVGAPAQTLTQLCAACSTETERLRPLLSALCEEGFLSHRRRRYEIAESTPSKRPRRPSSTAPAGARLGPRPLG
jgi:A/G-specific adenine glycosylase